MAILCSESEVFNSSLYKLCKLKHTRTFLIALQTTLQDAVSVLEANIIYHSRWYGLNSLPDTLLSSVFEELCIDIAEQDSKSFQGASKLSALRRDLSLVSRRFCQVAHTTPALWTFINSWDPKTCISHSLKLSRTLPLHFTIQSNSSRPDYETVLALAAPHVRRWRSLCFREIGVTRWAHIRTLLAGASFSNVTSIRFTEFCPLGFLDEDTFPALRELDVVHFIPPSHVMARLTSLSISHLVADHGRPIDYMLNSLSTARKLENLSITLEPGDFLDVVYRTEPCAEPLSVFLPSMVSLSIKAFDWARRLDVRLFKHMAWFTRALQMPSVSSIAIEVSCYNVGFVLEDLAFFQKDCTLDTVRSADIRVGLTNYDFRLDDPEEVCAFDMMAQQTKTFIQTLLNRMPAVQDLSLHVPGFVMGFEYTMICSGLKGLYVKGPHAVNSVDLYKFMDRARRGEVELERLTLVTVAVDTARSFYAGGTKEVVILEEKAGRVEVCWKEVERVEERKDRHAIAVLAKAV